ncbi:hypothetical protein KUBF_36630 [Bacteroides finegoldii]|nr:hypothetical protein KUBF_36630 [Bacteroides finegoldii]
MYKINEYKGNILSSAMIECGENILASSERIYELTRPLLSRVSRNLLQTQEMAEAQGDTPGEKEA